MKTIDLTNYAQRASTKVRHPVTHEIGYIYYLAKQGKYIFISEAQRLKKCPQDWAFKNHNIIVMSNETIHHVS